MTILTHVTVSFTQTSPYCSDLRNHSAFPVVFPFILPTFFLPIFARLRSSSLQLSPFPSSRIRFQPRFLSGNETSNPSSFRFLKPFVYLLLSPTSTTVSFSPPRLDCISPVHHPLPFLRFPSPYPLQSLLSRIERLTHFSTFFHSFPSIIAVFRCAGMPYSGHCHPCLFCSK